MERYYRLHPMSIWLHLVPKLHRSGANNIFPQHNAFVGHNDPSLFKGIVRPNSFSHGYQVRVTSPAIPFGKYVCLLLTNSYMTENHFGSL